MSGATNLNENEVWGCLSAGRQSNRPLDPELMYLRTDLASTAASSIAAIPAAEGLSLQACSRLEVSARATADKARLTWQIQLDACKDISICHPDPYTYATDFLHTRCYAQRRQVGKEPVLYLHVSESGCFKHVTPVVQRLYNGCTTCHPEHIDLP